MMMNAWLATDVVGLGTGLGKKDVLVIPKENGDSLAMHVTSDGRMWVENMEGQPTPENGLMEVEIPEELDETLKSIMKDGDKSITQDTGKIIFEFIRKVKWR
jgi:hypothetical protein